MAKLMNSHSKQVSPLTVWGRREIGLELCPCPAPGPLEWGLPADRSNQETLRGWLYPDPSMTHFVLPVCVHLFGRFF